MAMMVVSFIARVITPKEPSSMQQVPGEFRNALNGLL